MNYRKNEFGLFLQKVNKFQSYRLHTYSNSISFFHKVFIFFLLIIFVRLIQLQLIQGTSHLLLSENNRIRKIAISAPRGAIYDRNGVLLASTKRIFSLYIDPTGLDKGTIEKTIAKIENISKKLKLNLDLSKTSYLKNISSIIEKKAGGLPIKIATDIEFPLLCVILEQIDSFPGIIVKEEYLRWYPAQECAHLLGYIGKISQRELETLEEDSYSMDDVIGKCGIERKYERILRGINGGWIIEVDARGNKRRELGSVSPIPGKDIFLTIDKKLQEKASHLLADKRGTIIAMDPNSGAILALVSKPDYDPNSVTYPAKEDAWYKIMTNPHSPLQNRAVQSLYPPGSIFKLLTALSVLKDGAISPQTKIYCPGYFKLGNKTFKCWKEEGHGYVNLEEAIMQSCNVYFYNVARRTNLQTLLDLASEFGLGSVTGIDLPNEKEGLLPSPSWKKKKYRENWFLGDTIQLGIGQSYLLVTPLQMINVVATIANGGIVYRPYLVKEIRDPTNGAVSKIQSPQKIRNVNVLREHLQFIKKGMWLVVNGEKGTARLASLSDIGIAVAGKTGTAQIPGKAPIAWFCGFAPYENPEIALLVLVEEGGYGGLTAAPLARELFKTYFSLAKNEEINKLFATASLSNRLSKNDCN